ncbi:Crp/Fnr family transcriptional regulator [Actinocorallia aurea]
MDVTAKLRHDLESEGVEVRFSPGRPVLHQGDPPTHIALLLTGAVKIVLHLPDGERLLLATRGPGEVLGIMGVVGRAPRSATVVAVTPCLTRVLPADRFLSLVRAAGAEPALLRRTMLRVQEGEQWRAETATLPARPRVARALLRLSVAGAGRPEIPLSQSEIGAAVGMSRGAVAAELARMREAGLIETEVRRVVVTDPEGLRAVAASGHRGVIRMTAPPGRAEHR